MPEYPSLAFVYPGVGMQHVGMGKALLERYPKVEDILAEAKQVTGIDVRALWLEGPVEEMRDDLKGMTALTTFGYAYSRLLMEELGLKPAYVAGYSMGIYPTLAATGALTFANTLRCLHHSYKLMRKVMEGVQGDMVGVVGLSVAEVQRLCDLVRPHGIIQISNINGEHHLLVAGEHEAVEKFVPLAKAEGAFEVRAMGFDLPYHSRLVLDAAREFRLWLEDIPFHVPSCPIVSCIILEDLVDPHEVRQEVAYQISSCVRWHELILGLKERGIQHYLEVGPGRSLSKMTRGIDRAGQLFWVDNLKAIETLRETLPAKT
ncbi:MAG: ACP S-malonyltransferase [Myxococcota bacterium]